MKYGLTVLVLGCFVVAAAYSYFQRKKKSADQDQLVRLLAEGNYAQFDTLLEDMWNAGAIDAFHHLYLQMSEAILKDDELRMEHLLHQAGKLKLNDEQKASIWSRAMIYFTGRKRNSKCKECYEAIMKLKGCDELKHMAGLVYRVMVEKRTDDLVEIEDKLQTAQDEEKEFLLKLKEEIERNRR